jgi:hypothetical protein
LNDNFIPKGIASGYWSLKMYNRYGKEIFYDPNYNFDFHAEGISDGTYFYYLENQLENREYKGWLQIIR